MQKVIRHSNGGCPSLKNKQVNHFFVKINESLGLTRASTEANAQICEAKHQMLEINAKMIHYSNVVPEYDEH